MKKISDTKLEAIIATVIFWAVIKTNIGTGKKEIYLPENQLEECKKDLRETMKTREYTD